MLARISQGRCALTRPSFRPLLVHETSVVPADTCTVDTYGEYVIKMYIEHNSPVHSVEASAASAQAPEARTAPSSPTKPVPPIARWMGVPATEGTTAQHRKARADQSLRGDYTTVAPPSTQGAKTTRSKPSKSGTATSSRPPPGGEGKTRFVTYLCPYPVRLHILLPSSSQRFQ